ncbi:hypothetical protein [Schinkia azotoformans]|uniref:hypothetical protein n=1 Tax=Schinkia azotoformans TaxID=1454 RepID=UPI002DB87789|nr:hypothetical protein [Schinkia azotoformans]MEC1716480.1 hypothetical protein [Schinkia azotoformans]MEC1758793.1 hypothetical protein [Schinkia azotoformans]
MIQFGRLTPEAEKQGNNELFSERKEFLKVLKEEQLLYKVPVNTKEATFLYSNDDNTMNENGFEIREVSRLFDYNKDLKVILSVFIDLKTEEKSYVVKIWHNNNQLQYKEYVNAELINDREFPYTEDLTIATELFDDLSELSKEEEKDIITTAVYDPASCIASGSCCQFSGVTYSYCGKYCGYRQEAGGSDDGSDTINGLDACCFWHDYCLWEGLMSRCGCHDGFLDCASGTPAAPGDTTIRNGIRGAKVLDGCY